MAAAAWEHLDAPEKPADTDGPGAARSGAPAGSLGAMTEAQTSAPEPDPVRTGVPEVDAVLDSVEALDGPPWRSTPPSSRPRTTSCAARSTARPERPTACRRAASAWTPSWSAGAWPARASTPAS